MVDVVAAVIEMKKVDFSGKRKRGCALVVSGSFGERLRRSLGRKSTKAAGRNECEIEVGDYLGESEHRTRS